MHCSWLRTQPVTRAAQLGLSTMLRGPRPPGSAAHRLALHHQAAHHDAGALRHKGSWDGWVGVARVLHRAAKGDPQQQM